MDAGIAGLYEIESTAALALIGTYGNTLAKPELARVWNLTTRVASARAPRAVSRGS